MKRMMKTAALAAVVLCLLSGCGKDKTLPPAPTRSTAPIMPQSTAPTAQQTEYTPVYATAFENTLFLSTTPIEEWGGEEAECAPRAVTDGGRVCCGGEHELEEPITRVVILEPLAPRSTQDWFRGMAALEYIEGLEKLQMSGVSDMSHMFAGCPLLKELNISKWSVPDSVDMTGMFDGCDALAAKPGWYKPQ